VDDSVKTVSDKVVREISMKLRYTRYEGKRTGRVNAPGTKRFTLD
jgi:hypothetical protein